MTDEFDAFLACGILAHGFLRLRCNGCAEEKLVAFSCKRRGICPSCGTRRMNEAAAHLVDHVIPKVPVRQWVLSFPIPLRSLIAVHPECLLPVLQIIHRAIATFLYKQTSQQRDQAVNLHIHLHALVLEACMAIWLPRTSQTPRMRARLHLSPSHPSSTQPVRPPTARCKHYWPRSSRASCDC